MGKPVMTELGWKLINTCKFTDEIESQFYISEKGNKIYAIQHIVESEKDEF